MAMLTVRGLRAEVHQRLREQAARHGRSLEAEARAILEAGIAPETIDIVSALHRFVDEVHITEDEHAAIFPPRRRDTPLPVTLGDSGLSMRADSSTPASSS